MTPTLDEFLEHGAQRLQIMGENPEHYKKSMTAKYLAWLDNDWHTIKPKRKIKNWKSTLTNTLPHLSKEVADDIKTKQGEFLKQRYNV